MAHKALLVVWGILLVFLFGVFVSEKFLVRIFPQIIPPWIAAIHGALLIALMIVWAFIVVNA